MKNKTISQRLISSRIGFHYFQDTAHYTNRDLNIWLPKLTQLSAKWIILRSDYNRAIPEQFLSGLINSGITPIVHMPLPLPNTPAANDLKAIFEAYSRWGVKQVILFDKPNSLESWSASGWSQQDLVERFVDKFLPTALAVTQSGMTPVFPPLQPGGNYWDLSFLRQSLQSILRRGQSNLIKQMALSAYANTFNHELEWGMGGPEKWPNSKPYTKNDLSQDQCGFYNFEWVQAIAKPICEWEMPVILLGAGIKASGKGYSPEIHAEIMQYILERLNGIPENKAIPSYVQCCNFFTLTAEPGSEEFSQAWFKPNEEDLPIVKMLSLEPDAIEAPVVSSELGSKTLRQFENNYPDHPIEHYLLLPQYEWGVADFHLEVTRPFIQKHHPTVGFSTREAFLAKQVTVVGGESSFAEELLTEMRENGSIVERIYGDGTSIATQLSER